MQKCLRRHMRQKRNVKLNAILAEFRGLDRLAAAADDPIKHRCHNVIKPPSPDEFAEFLADMLCTSGYQCLGTFDEDMCIRPIPPFEMVEVQAYRTVRPCRSFPARRLAPVATGRAPGRPPRRQHVVRFAGCWPRYPPTACAA